jgi:hypothetical protein
MSHVREFVRVLWKISDTESSMPRREAPSVPWQRGKRIQVPVRSGRLPFLFQGYVVADIAHPADTSRNIPSAILLLEARKKSAELNDTAIDFDIDVARCSKALVLGNFRLDLRRDNAVLCRLAMPRNIAAASTHDCPGMRIHAIDIVQPPGIAIPPIAAMDAHHTIVVAALATKSSAATPRNA